LLTLLLLLGVSVPAWAQSEDELAAARSHLRRANTLYNLQRYSEAAREYEAAYEIKDVPELLFNIGQACRGAGEYNKALGAYKAYLRTVDVKNRAEVEARIADLQRLLADQKRTNEAPPNGTVVAPELRSPTTRSPSAPLAQTEPLAPPRAPPSPTAKIGAARNDAHAARIKRIAGITGAAVGVGAIVAGGALTALAYSTQKSMNRPAPGSAYDPAAASRMRAEQAAGGVLLGVGIGAAVAGAVLAVLGRRETARARVSVAPLTGGNVAGLSFTGGF
jgi:tetratricopeptide (TPR) repeat protein